MLVLCLDSSVSLLAAVTYHCSRSVEGPGISQLVQDNMAEGNLVKHSAVPQLTYMELHHGTGIFRLHF